MATKGEGNVHIYHPLQKCYNLQLLSTGKISMVPPCRTQQWKIFCRPLKGCAFLLEKPLWVGTAWWHNGRCQDLGQRWLV